MLENTCLHLRALEPEDLEYLYRWENDTSIWENGVTRNSFSHYALREYLTNSKSDIYEDHELRLIIELKDSKQAVGCIDLYDFDLHNQKVGIAILIDKNYRQQTIASQSIGLMIEYAFSFLQINQVYAHVIEKNTVSLSLFNSCGFTHTAILKKWVKILDGYSDVFVFQKIKI